MSHKIGIGICTGNREESFKRLLDSIDSNVGDIFVINSGAEEYKPETYDKKIKEVIIPKGKLPLNVCHSKNMLMRAMIKDDCQSLFILEDDVEILDNIVFEKYIKTAEITGIWSLSSGNGRFNKNPKTGQLQVKEIATYDDGTEVFFYHNTMAFFTYFHSGIIKKCGYMPEKLSKNCMEHVSHYYTIEKMGLLPYFWFFPDISRSFDYIYNPEEDDQKSVIQKDRSKWEENFRESCLIFKKIHGYAPQEIPSCTKEQLRERLDFLQKNYSRKVL